MRTLFTLLCLVAAVHSQWKGFRIAQESKPGAGDWDKNILGFVQPVQASTRTVKQYYGYGAASFVGAGSVSSAVRPKPKPDWIIMFLVWNKFGSSKGLMYYTVYDIKNSKKKPGRGGNMYAHYEVFGTSTAIRKVTTQFLDDPGEFKKEGYPKKRIKSGFAYLSYHNAWAPCCTDGHVFGPLAGVSKIYAWMTRGPKAKYNPTNSPHYWQFATWGTGAVPYLKLQNSLRIRLDNHVCDPKKDCNGNGSCNKKTGKCICNKNFGGAFCNKCAAGLTNYPKCYPVGCRSAPTYSGAGGGSYPASCAGARNYAYCTLTCASGYKPSGRARCYRGKWTTPTCHKPKPNDCLSQPAYTPATGGSYTSCKDVVHQGYCELDCKAGYTLSPAGSKGIQCNNGKWNKATAPKCVANKCSGWPNSNSGGTWSSPCTASGAASGATCTLTCPSGYSVANPTAKCVLGKWNSAPYCHQVCAGLPPNPVPAVTGFSWKPIAGSGQSTCANTRNGGGCTLVCPPGYTKLGDAKCNNGVWVMDDAECLNDLDCHTPPTNPQKPPGATIDCSGVNKGTGGKFQVPNGQGCTLNCPSGYAPSGKVMCSKSQFIDASCQKTAPSFPQLKCRCIQSRKTNGVTSWYECETQTAPYCTTFITHQGFDADEEFGQGKWKWNKATNTLTASGAQGGSWRCRPYSP